ncbi:hypothetical protein BH10ACT1_BH10ACT1_13440 [soil metagenome]
MADFDVNVVHDGGEVRLVVSGDFDASSLPIFVTVVDGLDDATSLVVLDLDGITYVDSTGVRAAQLVEKRFRQVVIRNAPAMARQVFEVTGLSHLLERSA